MGEEAKQLRWGRVVLAVFSVVPAFWFLRFIGVDPLDESRLLPYALLATALIVFVASRYPIIREVGRILAGANLVIALLAIRVFMRNVEDVGLGYSDEYALVFLFGYILLNLTLPGIVLAVAPVHPVRAGTEGLPAGYEYLDKRNRRLSLPQRLAFVLVSTLVIPFLMMGPIFYAIVAIPVAVGIYHVFNVLRTRKGETPNVARRMRLSPNMQKPAQKRSYWTVNASAYDNPELYEQ